MKYRGEVYMADLGKGNGSEQAGVRPVVIVQNNIGNKYSTTYIVAILTTSLKKRSMSTHVIVEHPFLSKASTVQLEQLRTLDQSRFGHFVGKLSDEDMIRVNKALRVSLGLPK